MRTLVLMLLAGLFLGSLIAPTSSHAQFMRELTSTSIELSPTYPEPGESVTASVSAYSSDTQGASISWFLDGTEVADARNTREMTFTTPLAGDPLALSVQVTLPDGQTLSASRTIDPVRLDIILEADTLVPLHYEGRPLPSQGSPMRAIAITDTDTAPSELSYTWSFDNEVLFGGPLLGRSVATFDAPQARTGVLSVGVADRSGRTIARKAIEVRTVSPFVYFYVDNPLRGLSRNAIQSPHNFLGEEMAVRAVPFYIDHDVFSQDPSVAWEINGRSIDNPSDDPQRITLQRGDGTGQFSVEFNIRNTENLLQGAKDDFVVTF